MLQRHEELKVEIKALKTAVLTTQPRQESSKTSVSAVINQLPISTVDQLKKIEIDLEGDLEYSELVSGLPNLFV